MLRLSNCLMSESVNCRLDVFRIDWLCVNSCDGSTMNVIQFRFSKILTGLSNSTNLNWSAVDSLDGLGPGMLNAMYWSAVDSLDGLGPGMLNAMDWSAVDSLDGLSLAIFDFLEIGRAHV